MYNSEQSTFLVFKDEHGYTDLQMIRALKSLRHSISQFAIRRIKTELYQCWKLVNEEAEEDKECNCENRVNFLLPCRHTLSPDKDTQVQVDMIHHRWYLGKQKGRQ